MEKECKVSTAGSRGALDNLGRDLARADAKNPDAAIELADLLISKALEARASDIHLHPQSDGALVRLRIDGQLHVAGRIPESLADSVVTRLKVMARAVVFERSRPQDGRIDWTPGTKGVTEPASAKSGPVVLRAAFLPTLHGEDVVIRFPETSGAPLSIDDLGMEAETRAVVENLLALEQGTILLTGPSSSGKTTTIYAMLRALHARRGNAAHVLTLEDPIEQDLAFAGQVPIRPDQGLGWAEGLRSVLRHDPNVILIGEIRDAETARIAIEAGLTGHLVISTVHSGRSVGVLVRLLHMGVEPFLVASSVTACLSQRLARRLCAGCRVEADPGEALRKRVGLDEHERLWRSTGCADCDSTGSRGRVGLFELLLMKSALREGVMNRLAEDALQALAFGAHDALLTDGVRKARAGVIGVEELNRLAASRAVERGGA